MKLGLVTYNLAANWDLATLLARCVETGVEGLELRTTHAHGVEPSLSPEQRREVKQRCADAGVVLWGLGSVCEFHAPDAGEVNRHIQSCRDFVRLAADLGARGVKVRPNGLPEGVPAERTLDQIGKALATCGAFASEHGVEIWLEVHGKHTALPAHIFSIMQACGHPAVGVCWNSNLTDCDDEGSVKQSFELLRPYLRSCHITDLESSYPWRELFSLFKLAGYDRFTLCEYGKSMDPTAGADFLKTYRRLWLELAGERGSSSAT